jgi:hypothetical protein
MTLFISYFTIPKNGDSFGIGNIFVTINTDKITQPLIKEMEQMITDKVKNPVVIINFREINE